MKKILGVAASAAMLAGGLVGFGTAPASAACPYGGCIPTSVFIDAPNRVERGDSARICVRVGSSGNGAPKGTLSIRVVRNAGGFRHVDARDYDGGRECFTTPDLTKRGEYIARVVFDKKPGSKWKDSDNLAEFRVVRRG